MRIGTTFTGSDNDNQGEEMSNESGSDRSHQRDSTAHRVYDLLDALVAMLAGHGGSVRLPADEMHERLRALVERM